MADVGKTYRRRGGCPERNAYIEDFNNLRNFVDKELGNGGTPQPTPDIAAWTVQRAKTIRELNEFRKKLDTICVNANYAKAAGSGAEIVGSVVSIIGAIMALYGNPSSPNVINFGNLTQRTGTVIEDISAMIENQLSEKYLRDIEKVLVKDKELSEPVAEWLRKSNGLDVRVKAVFGVSLSSGLLNTTIKAFTDILKFSCFSKDFGSIIRLIKQERYSLHIGRDIPIEKLEKFYQYVTTSPLPAGKIGRIFSVLNRPEVKCFKDGLLICRSIMGPSSSVVPTLQGDINLEIPTTGEVSAFCCFQVISLGVSLISCINAKNIIENGTSKYSEPLSKLIRSLDWELTRMENLEF